MTPAHEMAPYAVDCQPATPPHAVGDSGHGGGLARRAALAESAGSSPWALHRDVDRRQLDGGGGGEKTGRRLDIRGNGNKAANGSPFGTSRDVSARSAVCESTLATPFGTEEPRGPHRTPHEPPPRTVRTTAHDHRETRTTPIFSDAPFGVDSP